MVIMMTILAIIVIIVRTLKRDVDRIRVWRALELIQHLPATNMEPLEEVKESFDCAPDFSNKDILDA